MTAIVEVLNNALKLRHERGGQMAVHEECPATSASVLVDAVLGLLVLASTKGDGVELLGHVHLLCKSQEISDWVRAC